VNRSVGGLDGEEGLDPIQISYALIVLQHLMRSIQTSVLKAYYGGSNLVLSCHQMNQIRIVSKTLSVFHQLAFSGQKH